MSPRSCPPAVGAAGGHPAAPWEPQGVTQLPPIPRVSQSSPAPAVEPWLCRGCCFRGGFVFLAAASPSSASSLCSVLWARLWHCGVLHPPGLPGATTLLCSAVPSSVFLHPLLPTAPGLNAGTEQGEPPGPCLPPALGTARRSGQGRGGGLGMPEELVQRDRSSTGRV